VTEGNKERLKVIAFTGNLNNSASRFRIRQHIENLDKYHIKLKDCPAKWGQYPPQIKLLRPLWFCGALVNRIPHIIESSEYDISLIQREFISTFKTLELLTKKPRVFDIDDAIWLHGNGHHIRKIIEECNLVICGNEFIANKVQCWNKRIAIIPTAVDVSRFKPDYEKVSEKEFIIGWSGGSSGLSEVYKIEMELNTVLMEAQNAKLRILCDQRPSFSIIPKERIEYLKWSPENEVGAIQGMNVGIMPLEDNEWNSGKCSYKMLLYMSCGIPVVVSDIGMNRDVMKLGSPGFLIRKSKNWYDAIVELLRNPSKAHKMGVEGRNITVNKFNLDDISIKLSIELKGLRKNG